VNAKAAAWGGSFADEGLVGGSGSLSFPIACGWGVQFDASAAGFDSRFLGSLGSHVFWRDPSKALFGAYAAGTYWDQIGGIRVAHVGPESELYFGRITLQGVAGVEFGNSGANATQTFDVRTRFSDIANVAFYPTDNIKLYVGHRYLAGRHAAALGAELGLPMEHGTMAASFADGHASEGHFHGVLAGLRIYFGQKDKSLIRRHREDDPPNWMEGLNGAAAVSGISSTTASTNASMSCPIGTVLVGNLCLPIIPVM
jgi:hypothetical protein